MMIQKREKPITKAPPPARFPGKKPRNPQVPIMAPSVFSLKRLFGTWWREVRDVKTSSNFVFLNDNASDEIGRLSWEDGTFKFKGNAEESAKVFFDYVIEYMKEYIGKYYKEK